MTTDKVSDAVLDGIASIEMYRQVAEKESGSAVVCAEALRKLHALLELEQAVPHEAGIAPATAANIAAVSREISRVQALLGRSGQDAPKNGRPRNSGPQPRGGPGMQGPRSLPKAPAGRRTGRRGDF